jgi:hypothetical protein
LGRLPAQTLRFGYRTRIRNPNIEIRNKLEIPNSENPKRQIRIKHVLKFVFFSLLNLFRISDFVFRVFCSHSLAPLREIFPFWLTRFRASSFALGVENFSALVPDKPAVVWRSFAQDLTASPPIAQPSRRFAESQTAPETSPRENPLPGR